MGCSGDCFGGDACFDVDPRGAQASSSKPIRSPFASLSAAADGVEVNCVPINSSKSGWICFDADVVFAGLAFGGDPKIRRHVRS